ncbi:MAG: sigma-70 family RNA polymerase sigma factor [Pirellulales bacterium]
MYEEALATAGQGKRAITIGESNKGDRFVRHLEPLQGALEAYCRRSLRDQGEVPDVLQSAIANALQDFDLYAEGTNFRAWIFRYISYEVLNRNRAFARRRATDWPAEPSREPALSPIEELDYQALLREPDRVLDHCDDAVAIAVRELPELERQVLLLRAIGGLAYREIAEVLEVPLGTVMSYLSRARERMRRKLVEFGHERGLL